MPLARRSGKGSASLRRAITYLGHSFFWARCSELSLTSLPQTVEGTRWNALLSRAAGFNIQLSTLSSVSIHPDIFG